jgi:hypothetical protein
LSSPAPLLNKLAQLAPRPWRLDRGRAIEIGHLRGWGLEYGTLVEEIGSQPDYQRALKLAQLRGSLLTPAKLMNLYLLLRFGLPQLEQGDVIEFGSYKGGSAIFMGSLLRDFGSRARVFALDTYAGMPPTDAVRDLHSAGDFSDTSLDDFRRDLASAKLGDVVVPVQGVFSDTLPGLLADGRRIALAHVDCDIYEGVKYAVIASRPHMVADGYFVFDDPLHGSCLGAMQAIEETLLHEDRLFAEQMYPHPVYRYPPLG